MVEGREEGSLTSVPTSEGDCLRELRGEEQGGGRRVHQTLIEDYSEVKCDHTHLYSLRDEPGCTHWTSLLNWAKTSLI